MKLHGKTALVTGGGSGIGLAISNNLTSKGVTVIICGRNENKLKKAVEENPNLKYEVCDISNSAQIKTLVENLDSKYSGIDILVNNAGMFTQFDYKNGTPSLEEQLLEIEVDFAGPLKMIHHLLPMLKSRPEAAVANVSSALAIVPLAIAPVYCASKAAVHSWTKSFRLQMKGSNIKVFELMPPLVETPMVPDFEGQKMMKPETLAAAFVSGLEKDKYQINPGQSSQMNLMNRLAPKFIFNAINK